MDLTLNLKTNFMNRENGSYTKLPIDSYIFFDAIRILREKLKYTVFCSFLLCFLFFIYSPQIIYASSKEVIVGVYDNNPLLFMTESGPDGLFIDVLENIAEKEN